MIRLLILVFSLATSWSAIGKTLGKVTFVRGQTIAVKTNSRTHFLKRQRIEIRDQDGDALVMTLKKKNGKTHILTYHDEKKNILWEKGDSVFLGKIPRKSSRFWVLEGFGGVALDSNKNDIDVAKSAYDLDLDPGMLLGTRGLYRLDLAKHLFSIGPGFLYGEISGSGGNYAEGGFSLQQKSLYLTGSFDWHFRVTQRSGVGLGLDTFHPIVDEVELSGPTGSVTSNPEKEITLWPEALYLNTFYEISPRFSLTGRLLMPMLLGSTFGGRGFQGIVLGGSYAP